MDKIQTRYDSSQGLRWTVVQYQMFGPPRTCKCNASRQVRFEIDDRPKVEDNLYPECKLIREKILYIVALKSVLTVYLWEII